MISNRVTWKWILTGSLLATLVLTLSSSPSAAQPPATASETSGKPRIVVDKSSRFWLEGDSSLHRYKADATEFSVAFDVQAGSEPAAGVPATLEALARSTAIKGVEVSVPVDLLSSGDKGLDENMRKSLKSKEHPRISFRLESYKMLPASTEGAYALKLYGRLSIAGAEKPVDMVAQAVREPQGLRVTGSKEILMTDYGIDPPTMFLGTIRTENRVLVRFNLRLTLETSPTTPPDTHAAAK